MSNALKVLKTEQPSDADAELDLYELPELVDTFIADQHRAVEAVRAAGPSLAQAVAAALPRIKAGGRLLYAGAGTSGRLAVLDSVELYPTFSWPRERARAVLAGGDAAMFDAAEGAEDDFEQGARDLLALKPGPNDVALLLAASGRTPYVLGAMQAAREAGALTIGFANNPGAPVSMQAEIGVTLDTGPEVISGSTRLKAGSAQKMALNTFSSALMVKLHKVYGNLMVDLKTTNIKLRLRAIALTQRASGHDEVAAAAALEDCGWHVKLAVLALRRRLSAIEAQHLLDQHGGSLRAALGG